jgi:glutathione S-transferase
MTRTLGPDRRAERVTAAAHLMSPERVDDDEPEDPMGLKLFYVPFTRAGRARWMLEELGVPYELERIDVKGGQNHSPEYLEKVHPLGHVPALYDSQADVTIFESAAICMYLADKFIDKKLAPAFGSAARGPYYQWMVYSMAELEPTVAAINVLHKIPEAERDAAKFAEKRAKLVTAASVVKQHLARRGFDFMLGNDFSAADVMTAGVLGWARVLGALDDAELVTYLKRCTSRPAFAKSRAD